MNLVIVHPMLPPEQRNASETAVVERRKSPNTLNIEGPGLANKKIPENPSRISCGIHKRHSFAEVPLDLVFVMQPHLQHYQETKTNIF